MGTDLKGGDYIWIDNSNNNDIPNANLLATVLEANQQHAKVLIIQCKMEVTCFLDNKGVWSIGKKANVKIKTNPYLAGLAALTNHEIKMGTIS